MHKFKVFSSYQNKHVAVKQGCSTIQKWSWTGACWRSEQLGHQLL